MICSCSSNALNSVLVEYSSIRLLFNWIMSTSILYSEKSLNFSPGKCFSSNPLIQLCQCPPNSPKVGFVGGAPENLKQECAFCHQNKATLSTCRVTVGSQTSTTIGTITEKRGARGVGGKCLTQQIVAELRMV